MTDDYIMWCNKCDWVRVPGTWVRTTKDFKVNKTIYRGTCPKCEAKLQMVREL